jgi:exodeoxyribonuclease VII small subunit
MANRKKLTYKEAAEELEGIVAEIESEEIDVDVLAAKVKRAAWLIKTCKDRLRSTEDEVNRVLSGMEPAARPEETEEAGEPEGDSPLFG